MAPTLSPEETHRSPTPSSLASPDDQATRTSKSALEDQLDAEMHHHTLDELIRVALATFELRFGPVAARKLASLPCPERDLMVLAASGRYPCRLLAMLLRESQPVLAARIRAGVVHLRDAPPAGPLRP